MTTSSRMTESSVPKAEAAVLAAVRASQPGRRRPDEFVFQISKDEYLDLLFEDLALPNLRKNQHRQLNEYKTHRAGYTANGVPANISVVRSLQNSLATHGDNGRQTARTARAGNQPESSRKHGTGATAGRGAPAKRDCRTAGEDRPGAVYRHVRPALQELRKTP